MRIKEPQLRNFHLTNSLDKHSQSSIVTYAYTLSPTLLLFCGYLTTHFLS